MNSGYNSAGIRGTIIAKRMDPIMRIGTIAGAFVVYQSVPLLKPFPWAIPTEATCQSLPIPDGDVTYSTAVLPGGRYLIGTEALLYCGIVFNNRENTTTVDANSTWIKVCHSNDTWIDRHTCGT